MESNFFNDKESEGEFPQAFESYLTAKLEGNVGSLEFNEEEYEYVIDRLMEEGSADDVLELTNIAFKKFPYSSTILARLCDTLILQGNPDAALEILTEYLDSFSTNSSIYLLLARAHIVKGKFTHAREYFYKALEILEGDEDGIESICSLALDCIDGKNYREAIYYLDKAAKIGTLSYEYFNDYAFCYDKLDTPDKSVEYYNKYLDTNPFNDYVWFNLGTVLARLKEFDKAIEAFEYSIALNEKNSSSLYNLAVVYMNLQRYREGALTFEQFVEIDDDVLGKLGLAEAYIRLERFQEGVAVFNGVLESAPDCSEAQIGKDAIDAILCFRGGDIEGFKRAFKSVCDAGTAWLGVIHDMLPGLQREQWFMEFLDSLKR